MTIKQLLEYCRVKFPKVEITYLHPSLYILCVSADFAGLHDEARKSMFLKVTGIQERDLDRVLAVATISLCFVTEDERDSSYAFLKNRNSAQHWLPLLDAKLRDELPLREKNSVQAIHFYGYKGGQARTTVLAMLAKSLAHDGYRILLVDADTEAPSLDFLFDCLTDSPSSTLMGLCGWSDSVSPLPAYVFPVSGGKVDLLACRPRSDEYDMDFAAFCLRVTSDVEMLDEAVVRLQQYVAKLNEAQQYDFVIFDHRTGIAPSVLPIIRAWRGPVVVAVRPDGFSGQAMGAFASLFAQNPENPGAYVCFSMDQEDTREKVFDRAGDQIKKLLAELQEGIKRGAEEWTPLDVRAFHPYWVCWYFDRLFTNKTFPEFDRLSKDNLDSIRQLREVLGISTAKSKPHNSEHLESDSSARLDGLFVETPFLSELLSTRSRYCIILGQRGSGKTRLFREMANRKIAEPLIAGNDFQGGGVRWFSPAYMRLWDFCRGNARLFAWSLMRVALGMSDISGIGALDSRLGVWCASQQEPTVDDLIMECVDQVLDEGQRDFLVKWVDDAAVEAVSNEVLEQGKLVLAALVELAADMRDHVGFRNEVGIRFFWLFWLVKNERREAALVPYKLPWYTLDWETDHIFHFMLARITQMNWFKLHFPNAQKAIADCIDKIRYGRLGRAETENLLLKIFPEKMYRSNLHTLTYFRAAFSGVDSITALPGFAELFLKEINSQGTVGDQEGKEQLVRDRISEALILSAYQAASEQIKGAPKAAPQVSSVESDRDKEK